MGRKQKEITLTPEKMQLVEQYIPYAKRVADKIKKGDSHALSEAYWGLIYLTNMYNESTGVTYGTFLVKYLYKTVCQRVYKKDSVLYVDLQSKYDNCNHTYEEVLPSRTFMVTTDNLNYENSYITITSELTKKQKEVFDLYTSGLTMQQIADRLGKSKQAVSCVWKKALEVINSNYTYENFIF